MKPGIISAATHQRRDEMAKVINCACGATIRGETEDEVLDNAEEHVRTAHPDMVDQFPRKTLAGMVEDG
jgi:predicted small metal-binding protein